MKKTIYYAEDDKTVRESISRAISSFFPDHSIRSFEDGDSLSNALKNPCSNLEVVITDHSMPGKSGLKIIRDYAKKLRIPFILLYGDVRQIGDEAVKEGAFGYLIKPVIKLEELRDMIEKAINCKQI